MALDIYARLHTLLEVMTPAQRKQFNEQRESMPKTKIGGIEQPFSIEVQVNMCEVALGVGHAKPLKETAAHIPKHNGRQTESFTEGFEGGGDPISSDKQLLVKSYMLTCQMSEADARRALNLPPSEIANLGRAVIADWYLAKSGGTLTEAQCIEVAKKGRPVRR